VKLALKMLVY